MKNETENNHKTKAETGRAKIPVQRLVSWFINFIHPVPIEQRLLKIVLPEGFMNVVVTKNNRLIADTNNSKNWDVLNFPLPKGGWKIKSQDKKHLTLIRYR